MTDLYPIPAKKTIYKGVQLKSKLEARTAAALERIGMVVDKSHYEQKSFADESGIYTPDFGPYEIGVLGAPIEVAELYVEARPTQLGEHRRLAEQQAGTLALSVPEALLVFVGLKEFPAALLGWCYGVRNERILAVIGIRRDGHSGFQEPCLFLEGYAQAWMDGFLTQIVAA